MAEKKLYTEMLGTHCQLASIRQACGIIENLIDLAKSKCFVTSYIVNSMDECVKQMAKEISEMKKELAELNKDNADFDDFEDTLDNAVREHCEGVRNE